MPTAAEWLTEIRRIAPLPDPDALRETARLVDAIRLAGEPADDAWTAELLRGQHEHVERSMNRIAELMGTPERLTGHEPPALRQTAGLLTEADPLRRAALTLADEAEVAWYDHHLRAMAGTPLSQAAQLPKRILLVEQATIGLRRLKALTPEREDLAQQALRIAAAYRFAKRMAEASVARAGGNQIKAKKLELEAEEMRRQDFAKAGLTP